MPHPAKCTEFINAISIQRDRFFFFFFVSITKLDEKVQLTNFTILALLIYEKSHRICTMDFGQSLKCIRIDVRNGTIFVEM